MNKNNVVIADEDKEYVSAFSSYLMEHLPGVSIYSFTSEEAFLQSNEEFWLGILSKDFLSVLEFSQKQALEDKFYLCDDDIAKEYEHLPMVYKYQSMEIVEEMIKRKLQKNSSAWSVKKGDSKTQVIGIYSPISHELQMPFSLSLCEVLRERGSVLFLDIEEISIIGTLLSQKTEKTLMDLMYLVMQEEGEGPDLAEYVNSFMGVDYISPFTNPEELNDIPQEAWEGVIKLMLQAGYDTVVVLFGRTIKGFRQMVSLCDELYVLGKPGDYYKKSQNCFLEYAKSACQNTTLRTVSLPMSANNLMDGTYMMEELIQGNLGLFVRKVLQDGMASKDVCYGTT